MNLIKSQALTTKRFIGSKLVLGGIVVAASAIVGTAGMAAAQQTNNESFNQNKVALCKKEFRKLGFKNVGQCVSFFSHGHGYGGDGDHDHDDHGHGNQHHHHGFFGSFENFFFRF
jgi:hypothetical protein